LSDLMEVASVNMQIYIGIYCSMVEHGKYRTIDADTPVTTQKIQYVRSDD
jgi:hypothetical protein